MRRYFQHIFIPATFCVALALGACAADHAAPVHHMGAHVDSAAGAGAVMVREGETLWSIAKRYRLAQRDIIDLNHLRAPYHLADGQRLRLPPPMEHRVGARDTLSGLAQMYGVQTSQLAQINNLSAPYRLQQGQTLRIPSTVKRQQERQVAAVFTRQTSVAPPMPKPAVTNKTVVEKQTAKPVVVSKPPPPPVRPATAPPVVVATSKISRQGFIWPVKGKIISSYGPKAGHLHNDGINIAAPRGTAVAAAADGTVAYVGDALAGYGNLVLVRHDNGMVTAYAHLDRVTVTKNMRVVRGQAIGTVGSSGTVANAQLHFEIRKGLETLDPKKYLS